MSIGGSLAQPAETTEQLALLGTGTDGPAPEPGSPLKQAVAERLAEHRRRRAAERASEAARDAHNRARAEASRSASRRGAAMVREAVAARYQQSPSYREFLAAEAERALHQARAEAEIAARNAQAVADAQQQLLAELEAWTPAEESHLPAPGPVIVQDCPAEPASDRPSELANALADIALGARELLAQPPHTVYVDAAPLTVRLLDTLTPPPSSETRRPAPAPAPDELAELEQEIEFRRAPEFSPLVLETTPIPANIIEFPRQLVATRKARPRLAEGPLLEQRPQAPQLRIFEVEAEQISATPAPVTEAPGVPVWQTLVLEAAAEPAYALPAPAHEPHTSGAAAALHAAPVSLRLMAAAVDVLCVAGSMIGFVSAAVYVSGPSLREAPLPALAATVAVTFVTFLLLYQMLFFTFSDATPGMRYARIALCTFADENPTRKAMRRRCWASLLAACPLGLGLAWVVMDGDRLGWHDRLSRVYQRAY